MHIRLIPARAGNTTRASPSLVPSSAHPRSRGEHQLLDLCRSRNYGSSPLARGTLRGYHLPVGNGRLIPARAGNTVSLPRLRGRYPAHPRSHREHKEIRFRVGAQMGSSPLAQGTHDPVDLVDHWEGLIPARAGNTRGSSATGRSCPVHPRSRGEHWRHV